MNSTPLRRATSRAVPGEETRIVRASRMPRALQWQPVATTPRPLKCDSSGPGGAYVTMFPTPVAGKGSGKVASALPSAGQSQQPSA